MHTAQDLHKTFGKEWEDLEASARKLILLDAQQVEDLEQYRRDIWPGNLERYSRCLGGLEALCPILTRVS